MSGGFRADIQGLRALAVVLVVFYHAQVPGFGGGFIGVDVFFVISGYVIGASLLRELDRTDTIRLRRFYARRVRRLLPAFAVAAVFTLVVGTIVMPVGEAQVSAARTGLAATFSISNLYLMHTADRYFGPTVENNPFLHTWSLGVEEQFYLTVPLLLVVAIVATRHFKFRTRWTLTSVLILLTVASFAFSVRTMQVDPLVGFYHPASRFWEIGVGMLLVVLPPIQQSFSRLVACIAAAAGVVAILTVTFIYSDAMLFPGLTAVAPVAATALLIMTLPSSSLSGLASARASRWIGDRSYGWYLWHWPFILFAAELFGEDWWVMVAAGLSALAPTTLSYRWVEQPVRLRRPALSGWRLVTSSAITVCLLSLFAGGLVFGATNRWGITTPDLRSDTLAESMGCHSVRGDVEPDSCTIRRSGPLRFLLVGDSHASAMSNGVNDAAAAIGASLTVLTQDGCNAFDGYRFGNCDFYSSQVLQLIDAVEPTHVLVSHFSVRRTGWGDASLVTEWSTALKRFGDRIRNGGAELVAVADPPVYADVTAFPQSLLRPAVSPASMSAGEYEAQRSGISEAERQVADGWLDPGAALCDRTTCSTQASDGTWLYSDGDHLNHSGSTRAGVVLLPQLRLMLELED